MRRESFRKSRMFAKQHNEQSDSASEQHNEFLAATPLSVIQAHESNQTPQTDSRQSNEPAQSVATATVAAATAAHKAAIVNRNSSFGADSGFSERRNSSSYSQMAATNGQEQVAPPAAMDRLLAPQQQQQQPNEASGLVGEQLTAKEQRSQRFQNRFCSIMMERVHQADLLAKMGASSDQQLQQGAASSLKQPDDAVSAGGDEVYLEHRADFDKCPATCTSQLQQEQQPANSLSGQDQDLDQAQAKEARGATVEAAAPNAAASIVAAQKKFKQQTSLTSEGSASSKQGAAGSSRSKWLVAAVSICVSPSGHFVFVALFVLNFASIC